MKLKTLYNHHNVEGIRVGKYKIGINSTCIVYRIDKTLIDTGPSNQKKQVLNYAKAHNINQVLLTHHHEDHSGNAAHIKQQTGAEILAPKSSLTLLEQGFTLRLYQKIFWGTPPRVKAQPLPAEVKLGELTLEVIPAPGHSRDMVCFYEANKGWLFTGDLFVSRTQRYLRKDERLPIIFKTLQNLSTLDFNTLFCAHRGIVKQGKQAILEKLETLNSTRETALELHKKGLSPEEITRIMLGKEGSMRVITTGHYSKRNLIEGFLDPTWDSRTLE